MCSMYRKVPRERWQPLTMLGNPAALVGNAVGYRCAVCRLVFCRDCANQHFGIAGPDDEKNARVRIEAGLLAGVFDAQVVERATQLGMVMPPG